MAMQVPNLLFPILILGRSKVEERVSDGLPGKSEEDSDEKNLRMVPFHVKSSRCILIRSFFGLWVRPILHFSPSFSHVVLWICSLAIQKCFCNLKVKLFTVSTLIYFIKNKYYTFDGKLQGGSRTYQFKKLCSIELLISFYSMSFIFYSSILQIQSSSFTEYTFKDIPFVFDSANIVE